MTIDTNELRRLAQAVSGWSSCNQAWLDQSEDVPAATVGHIDEDGNTYPIATVDCDQYYAAHQSLPLAKFYAAANPATVAELLDRLEAAERERDECNRRRLEAADHFAAQTALMKEKYDALRAKIAEMERQEPVGWLLDGEFYEVRQMSLYKDNEPLQGQTALYALPGAQTQGEEK